MRRLLVAFVLLCSPAFAQEAKAPVVLPSEQANLLRQKMEAVGRAQLELDRAQSDFQAAYWKVRYEAGVPKDWQLNVEKMQFEPKEVKK